MFLFSLILIQVFIFAGFIFLFRNIFSRNVVSATKHLEELNQDYLKKTQEADRQLEEVKLKAQEILTGAKQEAENSLSQIIKGAEEEKDNLLKQAQAQAEEVMQRAEKSKQLLLSEMEGRISSEAVVKACQLIQDTLPEQFKKEVHQHWIQELIKGELGSMERLQLPEETEEIKIASAFALTEEQRKALSKKLKEAVGRDFKLKEEIDQKIVAGVVITIGSLVLDGSLKNRIQEKSRNA
jgi:F-type H+-transporting ATPase subunit b